MTMPPEKAGEDRLFTATITDFFLALAAGFAGSYVVEPDASDFSENVAVIVGSALVFSFVNHVFGMWLLRGSAGKLLWGLRVVRADDGRRPGFWRSVRRWLTGFAMLALMVAVGDGDTVGEASGLRTVRWRDLRRARQHFA
ncbi:RDD family protein [Streptomyces sp. 7-21]|jgi:hypothetical protein|uniref:RDD family protein n=1 Tax=Streptomyces sp. 7-21 TaxID=2802283 RepID=UPI00191D1075|nr:RDD family protein [Streptomyces sp. 7-21]MBL1068036.1 RDD family protein [Streptomyces sp. 7-21]